MLGRACPSVNKCGTLFHELTGPTPEDRSMKLMTIYAHPADTITNCGGALARHADAGDEIVAVILTHGGRIHPNAYAEEWRKEHPDEQVVSSGLAEIAGNKRRELERAAEIIGIRDLVLLDHDDTMSTVHEDVVGEVAEQIALHAPDVVIADYPANAVMSQSSHTIATMTALAAIDRAATYLKNLESADVILIGVSRSGKTPTSLYLAMQHGIKAANYPLIPEDFERMKLPEALRQHKSKLFGLTIAPERLHEIRKERRPNSTYAAADNCRYEVEEAEKLMRREGIHSINSTTKSIEEIATTILRELRIHRQVY